MIRYILKGLSHYIYLLLNMLDFKDNGFILIIILGMLVMCIKDKTIYKSCISVLKSIYNISKTKVGFLKYLKLYGWLICVIYLAINRRFYTESLEKKIREDGTEYWNARELSEVLQYKKWENFSRVIDRAKLACKNSGRNIEDDFPEVRKIVEAGATQKKSD